MSGIGELAIILGFWACYGDACIGIPKSVGPRLGDLGSQEIVATTIGMLLSWNLQMSGVFVTKERSGDGKEGDIRERRSRNKDRNSTITRRNWC